MAMVRSSHAMLDRLAAEESLLAVRRTALGSGAVTDEASAMRTMQRWIETAYPAMKPERPPKPTCADLRAMGIKGIKVPKVTHS